MKIYSLPRKADSLKTTRLWSDSLPLSQLSMSSISFDGIENFIFDEFLMPSQFLSADLGFIVFSLVNNSDTKFMEDGLSTNKSGSKWFTLFELDVDRSLLTSELFLCKCRRWIAIESRRSRKLTYPCKRRKNKLFSNYYDEIFHIIRKNQY